MRQRKPAEATSVDKSQKTNINAGKPAATKTGSDANPANGARPGSPEDEIQAREKVISPELRGLLSRKVEVMNKKEVAEHGGGV